MSSRLLAFLLAVVLFWSGLTTLEAPGGLASPSPEQGLALASEQAARDPGSVEHHHLDDLPAQAQSDTPPETPGLLPAPLAPSNERSVLAPHPFASAASGPPFLAGPLRPPCCAAQAG